MIKIIEQNWQHLYYTARQPICDLDNFSIGHHKFIDSLILTKDISCITKYKVVLLQCMYKLKKLNLLFKKPKK